MSGGFCYNRLTLSLKLLFVADLFLLGQAEYMCVARSRRVPRILYRRGLCTSKLPAERAITRIYRKKSRIWGGGVQMYAMSFIDGRFGPVLVLEPGS